MSRSRGHDKTGRSKKTLTNFVALERYLLTCAAWRSMKPVSRAAYIEVAACYTGDNNGSLQISARTLGDRLGMDKATASRALHDLEAKGFIKVTRKSLFNQKLKASAEYRLTAFKCDLTGELPTKAFMRWTPELQNSVAPVQPDSCTSATEGQKTTQNSPNQLHQCNREGPKQGVNGCTHAPLLYSTIGGSPSAWSQDPSSSPPSEEAPAQRAPPKRRSKQARVLNAKDKNSSSPTAPRAALRGATQRKGSP